ncbi:MAG: hypothetical protein IPJ41_04130 [Phycisphaerales bacterium]|nr:hypothetical protein [Phycisphaerales bacterium]
MRRAFALPMVIALVVVVGMMCAVMLERQAAQRGLAQRQLGWYQEHHARLGLQEAIDAWVRNLPTGVDLGTLLPADGHFLDLELKDGTDASVTLKEGQGAILTDLAAVEPVSYDDAAAELSAVASFYGPSGPPDGLRTVGPVALSLHTASAELIEIAAGAITGQADVATRFAQSIEQDRQANGGRCSPSAMGIAMSEAGVDADMRTRLGRMFTVRPTLYYATVELRDSSVGPAMARFGGYFIVANTRTSTTSGDRSAFLTWEKLGVE